MRDYLILMIIFTGLPLALAKPWIGILFYNWVSIMNPHRLAWGFASQSHPAKIVALATLVGFVLSKEKKVFTLDPLLISMLLFCVHFTVTTLLAINSSISWDEWDRTSKVFLMTFLTISLFRHKERLDLLIWIVILSAGFYGLKGGIFTLVTGGKHLVWGPEDSFFGGNNGLALALNMTLPLMYFWGINQERKIIKYGLLGGFFFTIFAIIGTHSRGGLVGLVAVLLVVSLNTLLRTKKNKFGFVFVSVCVLAGAFFAPEEWYERMETIQTYEEDASAMGRINAWWFAFHLATDRPLVGGGFNCFTPELFRKYAPEPENFHDSHSIYFEVLADHGYVGLAVYLTIIILVFVTLYRLNRISKRVPSLGWIRNYLFMFEASVIGYLSNGLTLGLAYFDLFWLVIAMIICLKLIVLEHLRELRINYLLQSESNPFS